MNNKYIVNWIDKKGLQRQSKPLSQEKAILWVTGANRQNPNIKYTMSNFTPEKEVELQDLEPTIFGNHLIDNETIEQMKQATSLPISVMGALMPDAHVGYGLPIGGVLATKNTVIPYAVGVDIACRMRLSIVCPLVGYLAPSYIPMMKDALLKQTYFGKGCVNKNKVNHEVMNDPLWESSNFLYSLKDMAWKQLGTSGGGNHFVEWGIVNIPEMNELGLDKGEYLGLLSHSGSRGLGHKIATKFTKIAKSFHPELKGQLSNLSWLDLDSKEGQDYWEAMTLAGKYASACHEVIHDSVLYHRFGSTKVLKVIENHHNFAWKEKYNEEELIIHRKGATPAGKGVLGIIPANMMDRSQIVIGLGNEQSLNSASHGAGRELGRKEAYRKLNESQWRNTIKKAGVELIGSALDEAPDAYKDIYQVMKAQDKLVKSVGYFEPKVVRMAGD